MPNALYLEFNDFKSKSVDRISFRSTQNGGLYVELGASKQEFRHFTDVLYDITIHK